MSQANPAAQAPSQLDRDLALAKTIAWIALDTPGILEMSGGRMAQVATYGRGESVRGVVVHPDEIEVHVVAAYPDSTPLPKTAERLRARLAGHVDDRSITIYIDDLAEEQP